MDLLKKPGNTFLRRLLFGCLLLALGSYCVMQVALNHSGMDAGEFSASWNGSDAALIDEFHAGLISSGGFGDFAFANTIDYAYQFGLLGFSLAAMILLIRKQAVPEARKRVLLHLCWLCPFLYAQDAAETTLITITLGDPLHVPRWAAVLHPVFFYLLAGTLAVETVVMLALAAGPIRSFSRRRAQERRIPRE